MASKFHSGLSNDFSLMLNDSDDYNVIIQVGKNREFRAHSYILRSRSPYFRNAFSKKEFQTTFIASEDGWITNDNMIKFKKPHINPTAFEIILKYMYTGEVNLTNQPGINVLELLVASDELLLEELFKHVQDYLIERQENWVQKNFSHVLRTVSKLESCKKLRDYCLESICAYPQPFFTSNDSLSLDKVSLYSLLKRDDLQIDEINIWEFLIKWGIEQTPGLGSDRTKWSNNNYKALKDTLNQFISLIRFVEISSADFFDKVRPYKTIIPDRIYEEIEEFHYKDTPPKKTILLPPRTGMIKMIESNIIKPELTIMITNWIERKDSNYNRSKKDKFYKFNLIYRKSRDGKNIIRNKCIGQGAVLILIKTKFSGKIFGGYNPIGWSNNYNKSYFFRNCNYISTTESFIFSLNEDTKGMKISRVVNSEYAIHDRSDMNEVNFGEGDLVLKNDYLTLRRVNYENLRRKSDSYKKYRVEEIEAFSVVKITN